MSLSFDCKRVSPSKVATLEEVVEVKECFDNNSATGLIDKDAPLDKFEADEGFKILPSL